MREVYDPIRQRWVAATPEEIVRQQWLKKMVEYLGFPRSCLAVEKDLKSLLPVGKMPPYLPSRRVDIVCFALKPDPLPLLIIECKAVPLTRSALHQVAGYNSYIGAPYFCIVNEKEICLHYRGNEINFLPRYEEFLQ